MAHGGGIDSVFDGIAQTMASKGFPWQDPRTQGQQPPPVTPPAGPEAGTPTGSRELPGFGGRRLDLFG